MKKAPWFIGITVLFIVGALLGNLISMLLWNLCISPLGLPKVGFWQMMGIVAFIEILLMPISSRRRRPTTP